MSDIAESQARAQVASIMVISNQNFPEAFAAMDAVGCVVLTRLFV